MIAISDRTLLKAVCPRCPVESDGNRLTVSGLLVGVSRLEERVTTMLCAWQISQGQLIVHPRPCVLRELLTGVVDRWRATAAERRLWLDLIFPTSAPSEMLTWNLDRTYFSLAMDHLLRNAIQFNPDGGAITLRLAHLAGDWLQIELADTGIGIPAEQQELIFEKFYRLGPARRRRVTGLPRPLSQTVGLGLYLVRGIVEAHDGRIWVENNDEGGATFKLELPRLPAWTNGEAHWSSPAPPARFRSHFA
jgi:signal transduction histidine kinase